MHDTVSERIRAMVRSLARDPSRPIEPADRLVEDLGLNSMTLVELATDLETEFGVTFGLDQAYLIATVADLEKFVAASVS
jgi:acyl carrier protein